MSELSALGIEFLNLIKKARYSFCVWVTLFIILFVPLPAFSKIETVREEAAPYLSVGFIFSFLIWGVEIFLWKWNERKTRNQEAEKERVRQANEAEELGGDAIRLPS